MVFRSFAYRRFEEYTMLQSRLSDHIVLAVQAEKNAIFWSQDDCRNLLLQRQ